MNSSDTRVETYLDDLARMLSDLEPGERDEVLAGIREHLDAAVAEHPDDPGAVDAALLRLGPPERVAAEARAGMPATSPPARGAAAVPYGGSAGPRNPVWVRVAVVLTLLAVLPPLVIAFVSRVLDLVQAATGALDRPAGMFAIGGAEVAVLMMLLAPLWLAALVATLVAPGIRRPVRLGLALVGPVAFVAVVVTAAWGNPEVLSAIGTAALTLGVAAVAVRLGVTAWREASTRHPALGGDPA